jgi:AhpD family alkylhydroperoxidase
VKKLDDNMIEYLEAARNSLQTLGQYNPEAMKGFNQFMGNVKKDGAISGKIKELIGVAISVSKQCKFCVSWHVKKALDLGATKEEIVEATMVAATLDGGPSLMFSKYVLKAIDDFTYK